MASAAPLLPVSSNGEEPNGSNGDEPTSNGTNGAQPKRTTRVPSMSFTEAISRRTSQFSLSPASSAATPTEDTILNMALGDKNIPRMGRRLSCVMSANRLFNRDRTQASRHGQRRKANVVRKNRKLSLFLLDGYHLVMDIPWRRFVTLFCVVYVMVYAFFALIYELASDSCNLDCRSFADAFFLSVETMMTIGFGVPDPFFKKCPWLVMIIIWQCFLGALLDASLVGMVYQRISAGGRRSATILFSDKAVIRAVGDAHYFMFQICEMRALQLCECHVDVYLYTRPLEDKGGSPKLARSSPICMVPMRLDQPDDNLGSSLLLALPTTVAHRIDAWSPLRGQPLPQALGDPEAASAFSEEWRFLPALRSSEADAGGMNTVWCSACGECFSRAEQLQRHVEYNARRSGGEDKGHCDLLEKLPKDPTPTEVRQQIQWLLQGHFVEILVVIEGIDPVTSSNVQARHSYIANDIVWDKSYVDCVQETVLPSGETSLLIDFARFHELESCELAESRSRSGSKAAKSKRAQAPSGALP